jgi:hypothetical protein
MGARPAKARCAAKDGCRGARSQRRRERAGQGRQSGRENEHGSVSIGTGNGPSCGRPSMSLTNIFYTSNPGFKGTDKLYILGFLTHGDIDQTFTILVK